MHTKITTKSGSTYNVREEAGRFFLNAENVPNYRMAKIDGEREITPRWPVAPGDRWQFTFKGDGPILAGGWDTITTSEVLSVETVL